MRQVLLLFVALAACAAMSAQKKVVFRANPALPVQFAPVPPNAAELVTGQTRLPSSPQERAALIDLMDKAMDNHNLHQRGGAPYDLRVSFTVAASMLYQGGSGTMEETWVSGKNWRWAAAFGNYSNVQLSSNGVVYGQNRAPQPIHFKLLRAAIFNPAGLAVRQIPIRSAGATWQGAPVTCILAGSEQSDQAPDEGRRWYQTEHCLNPQTGAIQIWSIAPGMYAIYNYANALSFHGHTLPGSITITENGTAVVEAQLTSITDADPSNLSLYTPTSQMQAEGPAPMANGMGKFPLIRFDSNIAPGAPVQPVIVHVTFDQQIKVLEIEPLQSSAFTTRAVAAVMAAPFGLVPPQPAQASPRSGEAFIDVQFRPMPDLPAAAQ